MLKRLQHHINVRIQKLLGQMILGTLIFLAVGFGLIVLYAFTENSTFLSLIWILGLVYALTYFIDVIKFGGIVKKLDQESVTSRIYISKAYY